MVGFFQKVEYSVIMIITDDKISDMGEMKADLMVLSRLLLAVLLGEDYDFRQINWRSSCSTRRRGTGTSLSCSSSSSRLGCSA